MASRWARLGIVVGATAAYAGLGVTALQRLGPGAGSFGMIPILIAALAFGLRGGLAAFGLLVVVDLVLYSLAGLGFLSLRMLPYLIFFALLTTAVGLLRDVYAERRRALLLERANAERLQFLVDKLPVLLWSTDRDLQVTFCRGTAIRPGAQAPDLDAHRRALAGEPTSIELVLKDRVYEAFVEPMRDGDGRIQGVLGTALDVTEKRRAEQESSDTHARYEAQMVRDSSERRRVEEALRYSQAKSRFLATMSHELRTPLNSVLGFAQLLSSTEFGGLTPRQARYVENIRASGRHLLDLVNDVLDVAEVHGGNVVLRLEPVDLRGQLVLSLDRIRGQAEAKDMRLELERGPDLCVRADPGRLSQVMSNLLTNAVKFTPEGGRIVITAEQEDGHVAITVSDTGIGIPVQEQARVFDEFVQLDGGRTRHQEGTGLGLALSRQLVELMGGSISLVSRPGSGSAFTIRLPLAAYDPREVGLPAWDSADPAAFPRRLTSSG
jgi:signal transduction histidine kinase